MYQEDAEYFDHRRQLVAEEDDRRKGTYTTSEGGVWIEEGEIEMVREPRKVSWLGDAKLDGVSYQSFPDTERPFKVRGTIEGQRSVRGFAICMSREEAERVHQQLGVFLDTGIEEP